MRMKMYFFHTVGLHDGSPSPLRTATKGRSRSLLQSRTFDWVLLDAHSELCGPVIDFCERVAHVAPRQRIAFLVGPPAYVSLKWPCDAIGEDKTEEQNATALKTAA